MKMKLPLFACALLAGFTAQALARNPQVSVKPEVNAERLTRVGHGLYGRTGTQPAGLLGPVTLQMAVPVASK